ncbi:aldolase [Karstenula rhodostoma CBS 690.94]|uniref:Aldolase n=1 Tax=Karstenula rhodostoma CBS 690.94 TaxID=1392251 RepID=A0A9P4UEJ2_9PLEO|nr:aldolase [Karstenula rhodostoma CBS 690.94]
MSSAPNQKELTGILVALVTPFTDDGSKIDQDRLKAHIDNLIRIGVHGLVPGGTTGEFTAMTIAERKELVELCVKFAAGRVPVVAGIGALSTAEGIELASHAAEAGSSALMVVPPFYDPVNLKQLKEMLGEIHKASGLDIMYYNIPSASGLVLSPKEIASLSEVGVKYLKDTSGNAPAFTELMFGHHEKITAFNGWDTLTFYGLAAGAKGSVWGTANVIPELSVQLWDAVAVKGDLKKGRELWQKIWPICAFLEEHNYPSAVKTGLELQGTKTGGLRKPFALLEGEPRETLLGLLKNAGCVTSE